jgi:parallel beta-helix repeat protein
MNRKLHVLILILAWLNLACGASAAPSQPPPKPMVSIAPSPRQPPATLGQPGAPTLAPVVSQTASAAQTATAIPLAAPSGVTYYVSTSGDDAGAGSQADPWATLQHAVEAVAPGDTILVLSGTYVGARIEQSGTAAGWITLKAAPAANVVVNAPGPNNVHGSILELETWEGDGVVAYWVIEGLEVTGAPSWGIDSRGNETAKNHHITIRGNRVHHNGLDSGRTGIFAAFTDYVLIEGNQSYNNGEHGIYVNNSSDYFTVRGNVLHDNVGCGVHLNGDADMGGDGILSAGLVESNIIYANGSLGGSAINMDGVADSLVRNNLLYNNFATGIALFQENGAVCSQNNQVLHNTILMPSNGRWGVLISDPACENNRLFNNIIYSAHATRGSINLAGGVPAGFQSDYNVVINRFTIDDGSSVISLSQWQALGFDTHSLVSEPTTLFLDSAQNDYHLKAGSPAIDLGLSQGVPFDLDGNPRPSGAGFDLGAYEYLSGGVAPTQIFVPLVTQGPPPSQTPAGGHVVYRVGENIYRVAAEAGAVPENLSAALDQYAAGVDDWVNIAPDGQWLLVGTERFDPECTGWACLALLSADLSQREVVRTGGQALHPGFSAVASGGNRIVYMDTDGPHDSDLWVINRQGQDWSTPVLLSGSSTFPANILPAISADGSQVAYSCSDDFYAVESGSICLVNTDGSGWRVAIAPTQVPGGSAQDALRHADFAPDGGLVFEDDLTGLGERVWRLAPGQTTPTLLGEYPNDNSPCVLPDGRVASLWLGRPGSSGVHELKAMAADGTTYVMLLVDQDVVDGGIGCGG